MATARKIQKLDVARQQAATSAPKDAPPGRLAVAARVAGMTERDFSAAVARACWPWSCVEMYLRLAPERLAADLRDARYSEQEVRHGRVVGGLEALADLLQPGATLAELSDVDRERVSIAALALLAPAERLEHARRELTGITTKTALRQRVLCQIAAITSAPPREWDREQAWRGAMLFTVLHSEAAVFGLPLHAELMNAIRRVVPIVRTDARGKYAALNELLELLGLGVDSTPKRKRNEHPLASQWRAAVRQAAERGWPDGIPWFDAARGEPSPRLQKKPG